MGNKDTTQGASEKAQSITEGDIEEYNVSTERMPESLKALSDEEYQRLHKKLVRNIDLFILPAIGILYILNYIDRQSLSAAKLQGIMEDLDLTTNDFATAISILFVGYLPFQIPSNLIITRIPRPGMYICVAVVVWEGISAATAAVKNYGQLLAVRAILGMVEAVSPRAPQMPWRYHKLTFVVGILPGSDLLPFSVVHQNGARQAIRRFIHRPASRQRIRRPIRCRDPPARWHLRYCWLAMAVHHRRLSYRGNWGHLCMHYARVSTQLPILVSRTARPRRLAHRERSGSSRRHRRRECSARVRQGTVGSKADLAHSVQYVVAGPGIDCELLPVTGRLLGVLENNQSAAHCSTVYLCWWGLLRDHVLLGS